MRILHYNNINFSIDGNGIITRGSTWHLMPDGNALENWTALAAEVREWIGETGDPWRVPGDDSSSFVTDDNYLVTAIKCTALARYMYEVEFTGTSRHINAEPVGQTEIKINEYGEREKSRRWLIHADSLDDFLPETGTPIAWAGELFLCSGIECKSLAGGKYEVTITARDMAVQMLGDPTISRNHVMETLKTAQWRVASDKLEDFLAANEINADASLWAGEGFHVTAQSSRPSGNLGSYVTLTAKHIGVRLTDIRRNTRFIGHDDNGGPVVETVCIGRWQVHRDSRNEFDLSVGTSASDWAGEGMTVVALNPIRISELEYEYTVEARDLSSDGASYAPMTYDPRDRLSNRVDISFSVMEWMISAAMAGWKYGDGNILVKINDDAPGSWIPAKHCPLLTGAELSPALVDSAHRCTMGTETFYRRGLPSRHSEMLSSWPGNEKIVNRYRGWNGSWLKYLQETAIVMDRKGQPWTAITRSYIQSPGGYAWNSGYEGLL